MYSYQYMFVSYQLSIYIYICVSYAFQNVKMYLFPVKIVSAFVSYEYIYELQHNIKIVMKTK